MKNLELFPWEDEQKIKIPTEKKQFTSIELFAGAGGLALGLEKAGFEAVLLNEWDKHACNTLRQIAQNGMY